MTHISEELENVCTSVTETTKVFNHFDDVQIVKRKNVDFEEALEETGFGKYNVLLIILCGLALFAANIESYGIGYVIPASECELNLNNYTKGLLTSTNLIGTMCSCTIWGYLSDFKGRKKLILINLIVAFVTGVMASMTSSFWGFCLLRLINGICIACPATVTFVYLGEFLNSSNKTKSMAWGTSFVALAFISLPLLGWPLLQSTINLEILGLRLNNWRIYMLVNSLPSILVALALLKLPESPKYLYHSGKFEEALLVLKQMYSINTNNPECTFPVASLDQKMVNEIHGTNQNIFRQLINQVVALFRPPFLTYTLVCCYMQAAAFAVSSGLYFWYPDIIKQISNNEHPDVTVCEALSFRNGFQESGPKCNNAVDDKIFVMNIIVGVAYIVAYATWGVLVRLLGTRNFFVTCMGLSAISTIAVCVLSKSMLIDIAFISAFVLSGTAVAIINVWVVDMFPTQICGFALCVTLTVGRLGSVISSSVFGMMAEWSCLTTFLLYALSILVCLGLSLLLPQKI